MLRRNRPLANPVTLVTGTRTGLGRFIAEYYLHQGHFVVGCSRGETDLRAERYQHFTADVADERAVQNIFGYLRREHGGVDHLINNAGIASMNLAMLTPLSTLDSIFSTNVKGTFLFCREAARLMQSRNAGRIVNLTSVATPLMLEGEAVYAASKAAVLSLTHILAREFAPFGITVNAVGPTPIETDLIRGVPREKIEALVARQAIKRLGAPQDVVNVIDFFLRPESNFVTGQNIYLGGVS
jgi:3-oxoacyl-[acyl-carrier protein] reductase